MAGEESYLEKLVTQMGLNEEERLLFETAYLLGQASIVGTDLRRAEDMVAQQRQHYIRMQQPADERIV